MLWRCHIVQECKYLSSEIDKLVSTVALEVTSHFSGVKSVATSLKSVATSLKSVATSLKSVATSLKSVATSLKSVATSLKSVAISLKSVVSSLWLSNSVFAGGIHFSSKEGTLFLPF